MHTTLGITDAKNQLPRLKTGNRKKKTSFLYFKSIVISIEGVTLMQLPHGLKTSVVISIKVWILYLIQKVRKSRCFRHLFFERKSSRKLSQIMICEFRVKFLHSRDTELKTAFYINNSLIMLFFSKRSQLSISGIIRISSHCYMFGL